MPQAPQGPSIPPHAQQYQPQLLQQSRAVAPYPDDYPYNMPQDQRQPGGGYPQLASPLPPYHPYQFSSRVDRQSLMSFASSKQAFFNATMDVSAMYLAPTMVHTPPGAVNHPNATNFAPHASQTISPRYIFDTPPTVLSAPPFPQPLKWSQAHCDVPNTDDRHWDLGAQYAQHSYTIPVNPGGTTDSNVNAIMRPNLIVTSDAVVTSPSGLPSIAPIAPTRRPTSQGRATNIAGGFCDSVMPLSQSNMVPEKLFSANIGGGTPGMNVCPTSGAFVPGTTSDGEDLAALPDLASFSWTVVNDQRAPLDANMQRWESSDLKR
ncbi:hypothetical protein DAEQUDRAFT_770089 [Daedalea quercina L-15889]|uniref:Uncharacterized protein n=1 Tax=Daedalea quercina L-15889 TaxID=1314783 RepID=A0A165L6G9_9APHY|nr:hypothetical protein DAEQUDRAFT_770089 [Daedalea quercina L-15889]